MGLGFTALGAFATLRRPDNRTGVLMLDRGADRARHRAADLRLVGAVRGGVAHRRARHHAVRHLLLAFPTGRIETPRGADRGDGRGRRGGAPDPRSCCSAPRRTSGATPPRTARTTSCSSRRAPRLTDVVEIVQALMLLGVILATVVLVLRRYLASGPVPRRGLAPVLLLGAVILLLAILSVALRDTARRPGRPGDLLLRVRDAARRVPRRARAQPPPARVDDRGARRPPDTRPQRRRDRRRAGRGARRPVAVRRLPPRRRLRVRRPHRPCGACSPARATTTSRRRSSTTAGSWRRSSTARSSPRSPSSLRAAARTAALALENARLEAQLRARLQALRAASARIVEAGDAERRRLGRDLHDGAQQRLVALMLELQLARESWERDRGPRPRPRRPGLRQRPRRGRRAARPRRRDPPRRPHPARPRRRDRVARDALARARSSSATRSTSACRCRSRRRPTTSSPRR